jgi:cell wall-associated NlpC family hydrolase
MVKQFFAAALIIILFASCSSLKPLNFTSNKQVVSTSAATSENSSRPNSTKNDVKFIDEIAVTPQSAGPAADTKTDNPVVTVEPKKETVTTRGFSIQETAGPTTGFFGDRSAALENASAVQIKYAILLNTEVEQLQNKILLESVDEWYGTRYRMGGTTKNGIDCSAFVQAVFATAYGMTLPRTAREQFRVAQRISRTELKEGDLLFFNTRGGVSHVGIYLQNNKFIHASTSKGVTVSDMFDPYYLKRFIAAGRLETEAPLTADNR